MTADVDEMRYTGRLDCLILRVKPPALGNVCRERLLLNELARGGGKRFGQAIPNDNSDKFGQRLRRWGVPTRMFAHSGQSEPIEAECRNRKKVTQLADRREQRAAIELHRYAPRELRQIEFYGLRTVRQICHAQQRIIVNLAQVSEHFAVLGIKERHCAAAESRMAASHCKHAPRPV